MRRHRLLFLTLLMLAMPAICPAQQQNAEQMASYYYQHKEYDKAIELYQPLYERTQNAFYYSMLYNCYIETDNMREAERLTEKRLKRHPNELTLYVDLGNLHMRRNEKKKAEKSYAAAIDKMGRDTKQVNDLALASENAGRNDMAIATYLQARKNMKNNYIYVMELATLYEKAGDYEQMMAEYFNLLDRSPGSMASIQIALQRAMNEASDDRLKEGLRNTIMQRVRQQPDNNAYLEMMLWFSLQEKDFDFALTQAKAVDSRFPEQGGAQVLRVARIAANNEAYDVAEQAYRHLIGKGQDNAYYFDSRVELLNARYQRLTSQHTMSATERQDLESQYEAALDELGKNERTTTLMRNYSHLLAYGENDSQQKGQGAKSRNHNPKLGTTERLQKAADLLYDIIEMPRLSPSVVNETKLELGDLLLFAGENWDASLLYSQVEKANKNDVLGALAKFKNAKLSYYTNDFLWAKSQLDVLRSSTSKLIANDAMELSLLISDNMEDDSTYDMLELYAAADLRLYRGQLDSAWTLLEEITHRTMSHALLDEVLMQKAKIRLRQGHYAEANSLLQFIVDHYAEDILADDALFMLADLNENELGNPQRALECYERLLLDYSSSLYNDRARKRYNALKRKYAE